MTGVQTCALPISRASRNALQHGLAAISHRQSVASDNIARLADAICGDCSDPALLAQARVIAQNEMALHAIREQQIALVERVRDPTAIALTKRYNTVRLMKARSKQARLAEKEMMRLLPKALEKYRDRLQGNPNDSRYELVPLALKLLLQEPDALEEQRALDRARKEI